MCDMLTQLVGAGLTSCTENAVVIDQTKNNTPIHYEISLDKNKKITKFKTNSSHMQSRIQSSNINLNTNVSNIVFTLQAIAKLPRSDTTSENTDDNTTYVGNKFLVIDRIKRYLHITPNKIGQKDNDFLIGFVLNGKQYYSKYDINTHSVTHLVLPDLMIDDRRVAIPEFSLSLNDENTANIKQFVEDSVGYIKRHHDNVRTLYEQQQHAQ